MGAIAADNADHVIVTDDNPRSEIRAASALGLLAAAKNATDIADRADAIRTEMALQQGDLLLIAGKGHETGQIVGDKVLPFSDHEALAAALAAGGMSVAPLWTIAEVARALGLVVEHP